LSFILNPAGNHDPSTLWELALARPGLSAERPPSLEWLLRANSVELYGHLAANSSRVEGSGHNGAGVFEAVVFFRVPLDAAQLAAFRSRDSAGNENGNGDSLERADSWQAFYFGSDDILGFEWQLRLHDLSKKSEWERWKILERPSILLSEQR
jgi:hypothetical protein